MKALVKNSTGIQLINKLIPSPSSINDVLVKVSHVGLCRTDLQVAKGIISIPQEEIILGHEFSAQIYEDPQKEFDFGQWIGFNPLVQNKFMGLDFDGAICEYIWLNRENIIASKLTDPILISYLEPVAASMAVLKALKTMNKFDKISIVGNNRIASLTQIVANSFGFDISILNEKELSSIDSNSYDCLIETVFEEEIISEILRILKPEGKFIIKSRKKQLIGVSSSALVTKEINMQAVNYYNFNSAMNWIETNGNLVTHLLGKEFSLPNWNEAFDLANTGEGKKIFINVREGQ